LTGTTDAFPRTRTPETPPSSASSLLREHRRHFLSGARLLCAPSCSSTPTTGTQYRDAQRGFGAQHVVGDSRERKEAPGADRDGPRICSGSLRTAHRGPDALRPIPAYFSGPSPAIVQPDGGVWFPALSPDPPRGVASPHNTVELVLPEDSLVVFY
jgi:hypothetical protein